MTEKVYGALIELLAIKLLEHDTDDGLNGAQTINGPFYSWLNAGHEDREFYRDRARDIEEGNWPFDGKDILTRYEMDRK